MMGTERRTPPVPKVGHWGRRALLVGTASVGSVGLLLEEVEGGELVGDRPLYHLLGLLHGG